MGNVHVYIHVLKLSLILLTYYRQNSLKCIDGSPVSSRNFLNSHRLTPYRPYIYKTQLQCNVTFIHITPRLHCNAPQEDSTLLATRYMQLLSFLSLICSKEQRLCVAFHNLPPLWPIHAAAPGTTRRQVYLMGSANQTWRLFTNTSSTCTWIWSKIGCLRLAAAQKRGFV